jgi:Putative bacterial sensory transduction regulator
MRSAVLAALCVGCATTTAPPIAFSNTESDMEMSACKDLDAEGIKYTVEHTESDSADAYIVTLWGNDAMPPYRIIIDSQASSKSGAERALVVYLYSGIVVEPAGRVATSMVLNDINENYWAGGFHIARDGELVLKWAINASEQGVHGFQIPDMVIRMSDVWVEVYPRLQSCDGCGAHVIDGHDGADAAPPPKVTPPNTKNDDEQQL